jgi:crossover junction endodeoxyribonuclease RusA
MADQETLYPVEFFIEGVPVSLGSSNRSRDRWKAIVAYTARQRQRETDELGFLDNRALAVTIYYFPSAPMEGDIDNIVKPILDALIGIAYLDDGVVERVVSQKFEPQVDWAFAAPSDRLATALDKPAPIVYVRVDDDLSWRRL